MTSTPNRLQGRLSLADWAWAVDVAKRRHDSYIQTYRQKYGIDPKDSPRLNVVGCAGELAVARYFGVPWTAGPDPDVSDVAGTQVRATEHRHGKLIAHPPDQLRIFVLVVVNVPRYTYHIKGWQYRDFIKQPQHWGDHFGRGRPCFAVGQDTLYSMDQLTLRRPH